MDAVKKKMKAACFTAAGSRDRELVVVVLATKSVSDKNSAESYEVSYFFPIYLS